VLSYLKQRIKNHKRRNRASSAWIEVDKQGGFNLDSLARASQGAKEAKEDAVIFLAGDFRVTQGEINFIDLKKQYQRGGEGSCHSLVPNDKNLLVNELNHQLELVHRRKGHSRWPGDRNIRADILARSRTTMQRYWKWPILAGFKIRPTSASSR